MWSTSTYAVQIHMCIMHVTYSVIVQQVVADQLKLEQEREAELELLYQEEAAKIWEKREAEWEKERRARERLMQEVNHTGKSQACIFAL